MGVWCLSLGNLLIRAAALLWNDARRSCTLLEGRQRARQSREHPDARLRANEAMLGAETGRSAFLPTHPRNAHQHPRLPRRTPRLTNPFTEI